eukprot:6346237-Prymnesium_polylepis.1
MLSIEPKTQRSRAGEAAARGSEFTTRISGLIPADVPSRWANLSSTPSRATAQAPLAAGSWLAGVRCSPRRPPGQRPLVAWRSRGRAAGAWWRRARRHVGERCDRAAMRCRYGKW